MRPLQLLFVASSLGKAEGATIQRNIYPQNRFHTVSKSHNLDFLSKLQELIALRLLSIPL